MSYKSFYYILLSIGICSQGRQVHNSRNGNQRLSHRISNGTSADIMQAPYMANLQIEGGQMIQCGGTIIDVFNIITAASCLEKAKIVRIRIGSSFRSSGGDEYIADSYSTHPNYNKNTRDFDIGIVVVNEGMRLNGFYSAPMGVVTMSNDPEVGEYMTITGWGKTSVNSEFSEELQRAKVPVIDRNDCRATYPALTNRMFCIRKVGQATNICRGDNGGPAIGEANLLDGVASIVRNNCGTQNSTGIFTRVGHPMVRAYIRGSTGI